LHKYESKYSLIIKDGGRMKRICLIILFLFTFISLVAVYQSNNTARIIAGNFLESKIQNSKIIEDFPIEENQQTIAYIFNLKPDGFIAVSSNNDVYPVIAYSFRNKLLAEDENNNLIYRMIKEDIPKRLDYYALNSEQTFHNQQVWRNFLNGQINSRDFMQYPPAGSTPTDGWVETQWNQTGVFNDFCPLDNSGERSVVGCVATAMAMIIDFHGYAGNVSFDNSDDYYSGSGGHIDNDHEERDFPSFSELNNYLDDLIDHYENEEMLTPNDLAALNFACGISVQMWYSSGGSGAYTSDVATALLNKFDFDSAYWTDNDDQSFYTQLANEMMNMRPAEMSIYTAGWNNGHAIICDGYNTDDYYHLNYGWGTSNSTCWYLLPYGMPSNYSIIGGAVVNIEGGSVPVNTQGIVNTPGISPIGTYITLEGPRFYECFVHEQNGNFEILAVEEGTYQATAILGDGRVYYESKEVYIDENDHFITFHLGNFEAVTGTVYAPVSAENCFITLYQNEEIVHTGIADANGNFSLPNVLPGIYSASASLDGNYFEQKEIEVSLDEQSFDFNLTEFPGNFSLSYAGSPDIVFSLIPNYTLTCAILLTDDELTEHTNDIISKIKFKSPITSGQGEIFAQIWKGNELLSEKQVENFSSGEWKEVILNNYIPIETGNQYYIGFKITSQTSDIVFTDQGPRTTGKGAYLHTNSWFELPALFDFNFCIDAGLVSEDYGIITGTVELDSGNGNISDVIVNSNFYHAHPDNSGFYEINLKPGIHDIHASLIDYVTSSIEGISLNNGDLLEGQNFILEYSPTGIENEDAVISKNFLLGNYPNPFHSSTNIYYSLTAENTEDAEIRIYNLKGQKVETIPVIRNGVEGSIDWNGKDENNKPVSSGIYLYRLIVDKQLVSSKKMMLIK